MLLIRKKERERGFRRRGGQLARSGRKEEKRRLEADDLP